MSTNACIAFTTEDGWKGRYHHWDGYPTGLGKALHRAVREHFKGDVQAAIQFFCLDHTGWSSIIDHDLSQPAGFRNAASHPNESFDETMARVRTLGPECYCHGDRAEEGWWINGPDERESWNYVMQPETNTMTIYGGGRVPTVVSFDTPTEEIDWQAIEERD